MVYRIVRLPVRRQGTKIGESMDCAEAFALADIDAIGQGALVAAGQLTAVELLDAAIIRLEAARDLNAVIHDLFDRGRRQAAELDASASPRNGEAGPLAGVPFLLKDLGASLAGTPEAMGSRALRTHVATETAWIVDRYRRPAWWCSARRILPSGATTAPPSRRCSGRPSTRGRRRSPRVGQAGDRLRRWPPVLFPRRREVTAPARSACPRRAAGSSA
jgi:amidase